MTIKSCHGHVVAPSLINKRLFLFSLAIIVSIFSLSIINADARTSAARPTSYLAQISHDQLTQDLNGEGVTIGIYDSGLNTTSEFFSSAIKNRIVSQHCLGESADVSLCDNLNPSHLLCSDVITGCYHGNAVAVLAAGNLTETEIKGSRELVGGVAWGSDINYIREAMNFDGTIKYSNFVEALQIFSDQVRTNSAHAPDVVNLSLSFSRDLFPDCEVQNEAKKEIDFLVKNKVVVVAAAGNDSDKSQISYPACMNNVLAVGSTSFKNGNETISEFSNSSNEIDIVAPGDNIIGSIPDDNHYAKISGTSFAAPLVSGAIALIKQQRPELGTDEIVPILQFHSNEVVDPKNNLAFKKLNLESISMPKQILVSATPDQSATPQQNEGVLLANTAEPVPLLATEAASENYRIELFVTVFLIIFVSSTYAYRKISANQIQKRHRYLNSGNQVYISDF